MNACAKPQRALPSWLITALIASGALAYSYLVFLPGQRAISKKRLLLRDRQTQLMQSDRLAAPIKLAEERLSHIRRIANQWQQDMPAGSELVLVYGQLSEQARLAGVLLRKLEPGTPVRLSTLEECPVELTLEGDYAQIMDFLGRVERLPATIWTRNLQLQSQQKSEAGQRLRCELSLTVFADISGNAGQVSRPNT